MEETTAISAALTELGFKFAHVPIEDGVERFDITIDEAEELEVGAILYQTDEGTFLRLMAYVDELSEDDPLAQLTLLMALNGNVPTGAFCMDPAEKVIYATVNIPAEEISSNLLGYMIDLMMIIQEIYFQEYYEDEPDEEIAKS
jgi:hypothetical protein